MEHLSTSSGPAVFTSCSIFSSKHRKDTFCSFHAFLYYTKPISVQFLDFKLLPCSECCMLSSGLTLSKYWKPLYTNLRKRDSHIKHNSLTSTIPWLTLTCALSLSHTHLRLHVGRCPPQLVSLLGPAPTMTPSF
jgi:hypothetical protein